jgi:hypothetical protein
MSIRMSTVLTAGLLASLIVAGSLVPAQAGDGCRKDKKGQTTSHWYSALSGALGGAARAEQG